VDIVFVSDHGMTDTSHPELVYMDDILGTAALEEIAHQDGWPSMGLRFSTTANASRHLEVLLKASYQNPEKFDVYTYGTMPERYHFAGNERIAPIYVVPKIGYVLTTHEEGDTSMSKGVSVFNFIVLKFRLLNSRLNRTMATITRQRRCKLCSLLTGHSPWK